MTVTALKSYLFPGLLPLTFDMIQAMTVTRAFFSMMDAHTPAGFYLLWQGLLSPFTVVSLVFLCSLYCEVPKIPLPMFACCSPEDLAPGQRDIGLVTSRFKPGVLFIMIEILYLPSKDTSISTRLIPYNSAS